MAGSMSDQTAGVFIDLAPQHPQLFFFTTPGEAPALLDLLQQPRVLDTLSSCAAGVAVALTDLDASQSAIMRLLANRGIPIIAWICPSSAKGGALSLANYPDAAACYRNLRTWVAQEQIQFAAVGLAVEPPADDSDPSDWSTWHALRSFARGLWLARDNALYPASKAAYRDLVATMRHDGYEVHGYQLPFVADDRRAHTTLMQRALDILDLPSDVDVLLCGSDVPIDWLNGDLGGALIASYGPHADAIGVAIAEDITHGTAYPPWPDLRRDLLLAAQHTDTIYVDSLEQCVHAGLLELIAQLDWDAPAHVRIGRLGLVQAGRTLIWGVLLLGRFGWRILSWVGWLLAFLLWLRGRRSRSL